MGCCGLLRDRHGGGGCWLIVGDGRGGLVVGDGGCCGLLGEWGHRGPLEVLVCCGLLWSAAEWMLGWDPKWIWLGLDGVVGLDQWLMVVG